MYRILLVLTLSLCITGCGTKSGKIAVSVPTMGANSNTAIQEINLTDMSSEQIAAMRPDLSGIPWKDLDEKQIAAMASVIKNAGVPGGTIYMYNFDEGMLEAADVLNRPGKSDDEDDSESDSKKSSKENGDSSNPPDTPGPLGGAGTDTPE